MRLLTLWICGTALTPVVWAGGGAVESFDYPAQQADSVVEDLDGGEGWVGPWIKDGGGASLGLDLFQGLEFEGLATGDGSAADTSPQGTAYRRRTALEPMMADGERWFGLLIEMRGLGGADIPGDQPYAFVGLSGEGDSSFMNGARAGLALGGFDLDKGRFGVRAVSGTKSGASEVLELELGRTYLLVGRIGDGGVTIFIDPTPGTDEPDSRRVSVVEGVGLPEEDFTNFTMVASGPDTGNLVEAVYDEIRVGDRFRDVAPTSP